jgi:NADPH-dependent ferric siderophore reductase
VHPHETHTPTSSKAKVAFPLPPRLLTIPGVQPLELEVSDVSDLGPRMRRIRLTDATLDRFACQPGQDVMLVLAGSGERPLSRRYTIRGHDRAARLLELNIVAHGVHGPGAAWAAAAQPGDRINGVGPRGKIYLDPSADWHLFVGDETAAPGYLNMLEALSSETPGRAFLEVAAVEDELSSSASGTHEVTWLHRGDTPAISSDRLVATMQAVDLPAGRGHVYIAGEVQVVNAVLRAALARGLAAEQVSPKAYWGRGKSNENNGEPLEKAGE